MHPLTTHFMTKSTHSRSSRVRLANAFDAMLLMWFWFKYRNRSDGKPPNAPGCSIVIWLSFKKIECSWVRPLKASVGTSLIWLNRKSLKKMKRLQISFVHSIKEIQFCGGRKRLDPQVEVLSEQFSVHSRSLSVRIMKFMLCKEHSRLLLSERDFSVKLFWCKNSRVTRFKCSWEEIGRRNLRSLLWKKHKIRVKMNKVKTFRKKNLKLKDKS